MLEVLAPAEVLPVWVFKPTFDHRFVRLVEGVFEIVDADRQAQLLAGPPIVSL